MKKKTGKNRTMKNKTVKNNTRKNRKLIIQNNEDIKYYKIKL